MNRAKKHQSVFVHIYVSNQLNHGLVPHSKPDKYNRVIRLEFEIYSFCYYTKQLPVYSSEQEVSKSVTVHVNRFG